MRRRIYDIINGTNEDDICVKIYDIFMILVILTSLISLMFKESPEILIYIDKACMVVFIVDYILRLITADYKFNKHSAISFIRYPFSLWAIIDLLSILPSMTILNRGFKLLRILRIGRALRVIKIFRHSRNFKILLAVLKKSKYMLSAVCAMAVGYIFISAVVVFSVEMDTFENFFQAVYWATISLTTVGYGDIYPVTLAGQIVSMVSAFVGIAIVALPTGIITGGYIDELNRRNENRKENYKDDGAENDEPKESEGVL